MRMIDADELLMLIDNHDNMVLKDVDSSCLKDVYKMAHVHIKDLIEMMPTIERKTGTWINTTQGDHYKCSCCGVRAAFWFDEENSSSWEKDMSEWLSEYCPNCGSEMRGDDYETD